MRIRGHIFVLGSLLVFIVLAVASNARAQGNPFDDATPYCQGDGGPAGMATDAEHEVLLGEAPLPPGVRTSDVSVDGVRTRVLQAGPVSSEDAVVFVHGNPGSSRDWDDLVAAGGRFARTVSFDVSGYGRSDKAARQVQSTVGAARYIQRLLDRLGIRRAVLVAHDFGGIWGLQWGAQHPDALSGVVLLNTGVLIDYQPHTRAVEWATPVVGEAQMATTTRESFRSGIQEGQPRPLPAEFVDRMYDGYDRATRCAALRYYRAGRDQTFFGGPADPRWQAAQLRKRVRPALVIWGEQDPYIPLRYAERQKEAFPAARIVRFPDSGHWPFVDNAARTRRHFVPFLRPRLTAAKPRLRAGRRRLRVRLRVNGPLPAHGLRVGLYRVDRRWGHARPAGRSRVVTSVSGSRTVGFRLRHAPRAGRYVLRLGARGVPPHRLRLRVKARDQRGR